MSGKLLIQAMTKMISGILLMTLLLFLPAGTWNWPEGWLLLGILFIPMLAAGFVLMAKNPELLKKRLNMQEKESEQIWVVALSGIQFVLCFVTAGLDCRFGWSHFPIWTTATAVVLFLAAYALYGEVLRENTYLSRTVEVQENQKVIDTGLYGIVRHPMYFAVILLFWSMPLVLGSWFAFLIMLPYPLLLVKRIRNEERVLTEGLEGYAEYRRRVKYRILPFIW